MARPVRFVGRSGELARIRQVLETARRGATAGAIVLGDPGEGKTALLAEAAIMAADAGLQVGRASCLSLTAPLPLDPALELLRSLGHPLHANGFREPREMFGIVVAALEQVSMAGPVCLTLDDLQWSDSATLDFVHYCIARLCDLPLAWLLAARPGGPQASLAHRLRHAGPISRMRLQPLSLAETRRLTREVVGRELGDAFVQRLHTRTRGNPFLCVELLRAIALPAGPALRGRVEELGDLVPIGISIEDRAARLSSAARSTLDWAAVLEERFSTEEIVAVAGPDSVSALSELREAGFLVDDGERWNFAHSIVRDAVYKRVPARERARRHSAAADALALGPLVRLAAQLAQARRWAEAARAYLELAEQARSSREGDDAAGLFDRACALAERGGDDALALEARAGRVLALVHWGAADEVTMPEVDAVRAALRATGDPDRRLTFLSRYAMELMTARPSMDLVRVRDAMVEARSLMEDVDVKTLALGLTAQGWLCLREGEYVEALRVSEQAIELARRIGDTALEATSLSAHWTSPASVGRG